jgi:hypothetical protein
MHRPFQDTGIPAALANSTEMSSEIKYVKWGRRNSDSYSAYTRLKPNARKVIFTKFTAALSHRRHLPSLTLNEKEPVARSLIQDERSRCIQ